MIKMLWSMVSKAAER